MVDRFIDLFKTGDTNKFIKNNPIEIVSPTERYKLVKYLSSGTYGDVFSAVNTKGQKLAVKITPLLNKSIREVWETLYANKECKVFVIDLIEAFIYKVDGIENTTWVVQIQELMEGDITRLDMDYNEISKLFVFLLQAINCLHKNGIAHLDVTTSNIFYKDGRFKLADFGLSCFKQEHTFNLFGKSLKSRKCKLYSTYIPPFFLEKKLKEKLSFEDAQKLDVWSIGVTIYKKMSDASIYNKKDSMMLNRLNYGNLEYIHKNLENVQGNLLIFYYFIIF